MQADQTPPNEADVPSAVKPRSKLSWVTWVVVASGVVLGLPLIIMNVAPMFEGPASNSCINNLRQIDGAKQQWALENRKSGGDVPTFADIAPYLGRGGAPATAISCPQGAATDNFFSSYEIGAVTNPPKCKIKPKEHRLQ